MRKFTAILLLALPGCAPFPEVTAAVSPAALAAPYPSLLPVDALPTPAPAAPAAATDPGAALAARAAALRAHAAALRTADAPPGG